MCCVHRPVRKTTVHDPLLYTMFSALAEEPATCSRFRALLDKRIRACIPNAGLPHTVRHINFLCPPTHIGEDAGSRMSCEPSCYKQSKVGRSCLACMDCSRKFEVLPSEDSKTKNDIENF